MSAELEAVKRVAATRRASLAILHDAIRAARKQGHTQQEIADAAGITKQRVSQILRDDN